MTLLKCSEPKSSQKWKQFLKRKKIWFAESIRNVIRYWYCLNCFLIQINLCLKMEYVTFSCQLVIMDGLQSNYSCWIYHDNTTKWNHTVQNGASEHKDHIGMPSILVRLINGILLPKLFWPTVRKKTFLKSVHFKKTIARISFLSKPWYFQYKSKQKMPQFNATRFAQLSS